MYALSVRDVQAYHLQRKYKVYLILDTVQRWAGSNFFNQDSCQFLGFKNFENAFEALVGPLRPGRGLRQRRLPRRRGVR